MNTLLRLVDWILNTTTMYRLMLYVLIVLVLVAALFGGIGLLPFNALYILASAAFLVALSVLANWAFARIFRAATNVESTYITALILALIINPDPPASNLVTLAVAAIAATASKYVLAFRRRHVFNPAAIAVVITSYALGRPPTWWVSAPVLLPFVLIGGVLIVRKIRRLDMVGTFFLTYFVALLVFAIAERVDLATQVRQTLLLSPLLFLAFVMLTEPLTMPPTRRLRMVYGGLVGFLIVPQVHVGGFYFTPEVALVVGNVFAWLVSAKATQMLWLKERRPISGEAEEFVFRQEHPVRFRPGQYLEWTLPHDHPDDRGDRRFFTISSPPGDDALAIGVEFKARSSSFKKRLKAMEPGERIAAGHLAGDFVMPRDPETEAGVRGRRDRGHALCQHDPRSAPARREERHRGPRHKQVRDGCCVPGRLRAGAGRARRPHGLHTDRPCRDPSRRLDGKDRPHRRDVPPRGDPRLPGESLLHLRLPAPGQRDQGSAGPPRRRAWQCTKRLLPRPGVGAY